MESGFGLHLVRIDERTTAYDPQLADVYESVQREWLTVRRSEAIDELYERLAENYSISIEASPQALPDEGESP